MSAKQTYQLVCDRCGHVALAPATPEHPRMAGEVRTILAQAGWTYIPKQRDRGWPISVDLCPACSAAPEAA